MNNSIPIYKQIRGAVLEGIYTRKYLPGTMLPSNKHFSVEWGVNHLTIKHALRSLIQEKVLESCRGVGTKVSINAYETIRKREREHFLNSELPKIREKALNLGVKISWSDLEHWVEKPGRHGNPQWLRI